jgi:DNA-binding NtrC family response regulator
MLPPPLQDLAVRAAAIDGALGDRVADAFSRLIRTSEALAWARDRLPELIACTTESELLDELVRQARALTGAPEVWALVWRGPVGAGASLSAISGVGSEGLRLMGEAVREPETLSKSVVGRVLRDRRPAWSDDARNEPGLRAAASVHLAALRSVGCLPLGRNAVLYLADPTTAARFDADVRARLAALCELATAFLERPPPLPRPTEPLPGLVGSGPAMRELCAAIRAFAPMPWPALILGETGTGKEAVARALHGESGRSDRPFVAVNCGAIPDELAESHLFGHEKGAFTGAGHRREGVVEQVADGTLFLDEVGELSGRVQVKLLRLLQESTFTRLGGERELRFSGRVVAATHRSIDDNANRDIFRADLYHRLAATVLRVPPLRDRREDIPALAEHLLARSAAELPGRPRLELEAATVRWLQTAELSGNVRELVNLLRGGIARALGRGSTRLALADIGALPEAAAPTRPQHRSDAPPPRPPPDSDDLSTIVDTAQRDRVAQALAVNHGNKTRAARDLGVSRQWLHRLMSRWEQP